MKSFKILIILGSLVANTMMFAAKANSDLYQSAVSKIEASPGMKVAMVDMMWDGGSIVVTLADMAGNQVNVFILNAKRSAAAHGIQFVPYDSRRHVEDSTITLDDEKRLRGSVASAIRKYLANKTATLSTTESTNSTLLLSFVASKERHEVSEFHWALEKPSKR